MLQPPGSSGGAKRHGTTSRRKAQESPDDIIKQLQRLPANRLCCDCSSKLPSCVNLNIGSFVCISCAGIHREMNQRVKGVGHSSFTSEEAARMKNSDNDKVNAVYLARYNPNSERLLRPTDNSDQQHLRAWILRKYQDKAWYNARQEPTPPSATMVQLPLESKKQDAQVDLMGGFDLNHPKTSQQVDEWDAFGSQASSITVAAQDRLPSDQNWASFGNTAQVPTSDQQQVFQADFSSVNQGHVQSPQYDASGSTSNRLKPSMQNDFADFRGLESASPNLPSQHTVQTFADFQSQAQASLGLQEKAVPNSITQSPSFIGAADRSIGATSFLSYEGFQQQNISVVQSPLQVPSLQHGSVAHGQTLQQVMPASGQATLQHVNSTQHPLGNPQHLVGGTQSSQFVEPMIPMLHHQPKLPQLIVQGHLDGHKLNSQEGTNISTVGQPSPVQRHLIAGHTVSYDPSSNVAPFVGHAPVLSSDEKASSDAPSSRITDAFADLNLSKREPSFQAGGKKNTTSPYSSGQKVFYRSASYIGHAEVIKVHLDDELEPFYTVLVDGKEKQTDDSHLSNHHPLCDEIVELLGFLTLSQLQQVKYFVEQLRLAPSTNGSLSMNDLPMPVPSNVTPLPSAQTPGRLSSTKGVLSTSVPFHGLPSTEKHSDPTQQIPQQTIGKDTDRSASALGFGSFEGIPSPQSAGLPSAVIPSVLPNSPFASQMTGHVWQQTGQIHQTSLPQVEPHSHYTFPQPSHPSYTSAEKPLPHNAQVGALQQSPHRPAQYGTPSLGGTQQQIQRAHPVGAMQQLSQHGETEAPLSPRGNPFDIY